MTRRIRTALASFASEADEEAVTLLTNRLRALGDRSGRGERGRCRHRLDRRPAASRRPSS